MRRPLVVLGLLLAAACSSKSEVKGGGSESKPDPAKPSLTLFALAEVRGQIGPCGCTSDPLGDMSRTTQLIADARAKGPVLVVDAGSLLYTEKFPIPDHLRAQEDLKANLLASIYKDQIKPAGVGLGPADLSAGMASLRFPRQVANVTQAADASAPPAVVTVGGTKVGVFGVTATDAISGLMQGSASIPVGDPVAAGKQAVADLKKQGAQVVIALVQATSKREAVSLVRDIGGIDVAVGGLGALAPEPEEVSPEPDKIGDGWMVIPGNRGQVLSRVDITLRPGAQGPLVNAIGPSAASVEIERMQRDIKRADDELAKFRNDPSADKAFIKQKEAEADQQRAQLKQLQAQPLVVPAKGSYFTLDQIRINKKLACNVAVRDAIKKYDQDAGDANVKAAANKAVPAPAKGKSSYVGNEACSDCHQEAVDYWKTTVHAQAWKTLVDRGQQFDYQCIGCHVTGWDQPGGTNLASAAHNETLRDVGCETCHGPGSIHVAKGGLEKPFAVVRAPAPDLCATQCHTKEHSDTFERTAYLRDILGKGHGEKARAALGDGPTGHELRKAALDKAGHELGPNCVDTQ